MKQIKNKLLVFLILFSLNIQSQTASKLLPVQNAHQSVSPNNFVYTVPPTDNRFYVASMDALRLKTFNVSGFNDTVKNVGDIRYKSISYVPSWIDVTSKPDLRTKSQNDTYYKDITYNPSWSDVSGRPEMSNYYLASNPANYISSVPAQSWSSITDKPSFSNVATSGSYTDLSNKPTKSDLGLSNIDNTSDLSKPISNAVQIALNGKLSAEIDGSITNELQTLSISGNNISISSGNSVSIPLNYIVNTATVGLSKAQLNTLYPDVTVRYMVLCPNILLGGAVYIKAIENGTNDTWQTISAPPTL